MATVGAADQNNPAISFPLSATPEHVRRSWARFETAASVIERLADLAAVMGAAIMGAAVMGPH
jgi:hypothetical protein